MIREDPSIRVAVRGDMDRVADIFSFYVLHSVATFEQKPPTADDWRQKHERLTALKLPFFVAERERRVLGFAYASAWREKPGYRYTAEDTVYVAPEAVGQGLGRRLLDVLIVACSDAGIHQLIAVIADTGDRASQAVHRACGFHEVGRLHAVGYKHDRWVDTVLMQRELIPGDLHV